MKRTLLLICLLSTFVLPLAALAADKYPTFTEVYDNLDTREKTKLHAKEYLTANRGKYVEVEGKVVEVVGKPGKAKIFLNNEDRPAPKGFNITISVMGDTRDAASLEKGKKVKFKGTLQDVDTNRDGSIIIDLVAGQLL